MGRRAKAEVGDAISLFPFLSILACVIGILTLLITTLALSQVAQPPVDAADEAARQQAIEAARQRTAEFKEIRAQLEADRAQRDRLQQMIEKAGAQLQQLTDLRKQAQQLQARLDAAKAAAAAAQQVQAAMAQMQQRLADILKRIAELDTEKAALAAEIKKLQDEIAARKKPPEEAAVMIEPSGSGENLRPTFIEAGRDGIAIHRAAGEPVRVRTSDLATSPDYQKLLADLANKNDRTIIFLVRQDGVWTYYRARDIARNAYVRNGKIPVEGQGRIDLSMFKDLMK
jgi:multidrug efflux pump subunit AcrA (membrane-fusion protein)